MPQIDEKTKQKMNGLLPWLGFGLIFVAGRYYSIPPSVATVEPAPTQVEVIQEQTTEPETSETDGVDVPENVQPVAIASPYKDQANITLGVLRQHISALAYQYSKLPRNELTDQCWPNRLAIQAIQDEFEGGSHINPSDFAGREGLLLDDLVCRMAFHYRETGEAPDLSITDISALEGVPDEWKED